MSLRVALLRSDDAHHVHLSGLLRAHFGLVAEVVEPARCQEQRLLHHGRHVDYVARVYHRARRCLFGLDRYRQAQFAQVPAAPPADVTAEVAWINDGRVADILRAAVPDVTVIIGVSVLRVSVLRAVSGPVLNIHGGWLPDYRGNHAIFFALYHNEPHKVGATIHFVDPGVDTGDLIEVVAPEVDPDASAEVLYCRAEHAAFARLLYWLTVLAEGSALPRHPQPRGYGRTFRTRDRHPGHDIALWWRRSRSR